MHPRDSNADNLTAVVPDSLVRLFLQLINPLTFSKENLRLFQAILLGETLKRANACSDYWRERIGTASAIADPWEMLNRIRPSSRAELVDNHLESLTVQTQPAIVYHSGGTTGRPPLVIHCSQQELSFLDSFFDKAGEALAANGLPKRRIVISTTNRASHGNIIVLEKGFHRKKYVFGMDSMSDAIMASEILTLLKHRHDMTGADEKVSSVGTTTPFAIYLTAKMLLEGFDFGELAVETVQHGTTYMAQRWRQIIRESWQAETVSIYSMAEIIGKATECSMCGLLHFQPFIIAELLDPWSCQQIEEGVGILVLSSLFPFVQMQPRIRYLTEDLFERRRSDCPFSAGYRFLGRKENAGAITAGSRFVPMVLPVLLYEELDKWPDVNRFPYPGSEDLPPAFTHATGHPIFAVQTIGDEGSVQESKLTIQVKVEFRYDPRLFPERVAALSQKLYRVLHEQCASLARQLPHTIDYSILPLSPGGLERSYEKI